MRHISTYLKAHRAALRSNPPEPERVLWRHLRGTQLGTKFRRQHSIGSFVVDFYAPAVRLAIEIDGESHCGAANARQQDDRRDAALAANGITVLRFTNPDVMHNAEGVCARVRETIASLQQCSHSLPNTPSNSPSR